MAIKVGLKEDRRRARLEAKAQGLSLKGSSLEDRYKTDSNGRLTFNPAIATERNFMPDRQINVPSVRKTIPTVLSDSNIRDNVIPDLQKRTNSLIPDKRLFLNPGETSDQYKERVSGIQTKDNTQEDNIYSSFFKNTTTPESKPSKEEISADKKYEDILKQMKQSLDRQAEEQISNIENLYKVRKSQMQESISSEGSAIRTALRGAGSRYAPGSAGGIMSHQEQQGILRLAQLDADEQNAISRVKSARDEGNFRLLETELNNAEKIASEKRKARQELFEETSKKNKQINLENNVINAFEQGVTNPADISQYLQENGVDDVTLDEISKIIKIINPNENLSGLSTDFRTYQYLKEIKDPSVEGLNYLEFTAAIANSKRKATGDTRTTPETQGEEGDYDFVRKGFLMPDGSIKKVKYTPAQEQEIREANLSGEDAVSFFLNTPKSFRDEFIRNRTVDSGGKYSIQQIFEAYQDWYTKETGDEEDNDSPY